MRHMEHQSLDDQYRSGDPFVKDPAGGSHFLRNREAHSEDLEMATAENNEDIVPA
jgi:hypothetical protein